MTHTSNSFLQLLPPVTRQPSSQCIFLCLIGTLFTECSHSADKTATSIGWALPTISTLMLRVIRPPLRTRSPRNDTIHLLGAAYKPDHRLKVSSRQELHKLDMVVMFTCGEQQQRHFGGGAQILRTRNSRITTTTKMHGRN